MLPAARPQVSSLYVIYDADGTRTGELIYIAKKLLGLAHCAACDITHGPRREKPEFTELKLTWPVPVHNIHRDEMDIAMETAVLGVLPCVVARTHTADFVVMRPDELELCAGDVVSFAKRVRACVERADLRMPEKRVDVCQVRIRAVEELDVAQKRKQYDADDECSTSSNGDAVVPVPTSLYGA